MRWEKQRISGGGEPQLPLGVDDAPARGTGRAGLAEPGPEPVPAGTEDALAIEVRARSIINRVPGAAQVPFSWTINPYRGCSHACRYCFARNTHTYLDLDSGRDFDSKIVVKVNAPELVRRELAHPKWAGEPIAMGTNTDPYQRAEGRYGLMRRIIEALRDRANPFSILTKGTLILRDLDLLTQAARLAPVSVAVSIGSIDEQVWRDIEPGAPSPLRRVDVVRRLSAAGLGCSVMMAPVLPGLSDGPQQLDETVAALAEAGATSITPLVLHLRPGAREWYHAWLSSHRPDLLPLYERLYRNGAYAPKSYQDDIAQRVREAQRRYGMGSRRSGAETFRAAPARSEPAEREAAQLALL